MLAGSASAHDRQRTRRRSGESLPIRVCSPPARRRCPAERTRPSPSCTTGISISATRTPSGRTGFPRGFAPRICGPPPGRRRIFSGDQKTVVQFPAALTGQDGMAFVTADPASCPPIPSSRLHPSPPTKTCGRSPLAAPVVFLTGQSRGRTRPRGRGRPGRRLGAADVLEAGTAAGSADRTAGGRNRGRHSPGIAPAIFGRPGRPAARTKNPAFSCTKSNRGGEIRTLDLLVPNQAR